MQFTYKVKDKNGQTSKGVLESDSQESATKSLKEKHFYVIMLEPKSGGLNFGFFQKKVSIKDKIIFTKQLGIMIKSGLSIIEALDALEEESQSIYFGKQIRLISDEIQGGTPFSDALEKHKNIFSDIYINMVRSGERSGKVDLVLDRLALQLEKEYDLNRKIKGALSYPIFVVFALTAVSILVLTIIIPQLKIIFDDAGVPLPILTKVVIAISEILLNYGLYCLAAVVVLILFVNRFAKTISGKKFFDNLIIKVPVFGTLLKKTYMARFTRNFAALAASGLPLLDVFKVTSNTIGNVIYKAEVERMANAVKSGETVSAAIKSSRLFPKMIGQLSIVGEKSGSLDEVFDTLADFFEKDVDTMTASLSTLLEPIIMVILGVGIGLIILSVIQPMYGLVNAV